MKRAQASPMISGDERSQSLEKALEGHYGKPLSELPKKLSEHVVGEFFPYKWDSLSEQQRRFRAQQSDNTRNPEVAAAFAVGFYELDKAAQSPKISAIQAAKLLLIRDGDLLTRLGPPCVEEEAPLAERLLTADEMRDGVDTKKLIATTYLTYAEWLRRAREQSIEYLPEHDLAAEKYGRPPKVKANIPPARFVRALESLLQKIEAAAKMAGVPFDRKKMPGMDKNLFDLAKKQQGFPIGKSVGTFQKYRKASGLCSFCTHATKTDFYEKLFE